MHRLEYYISAKDKLLRCGYTTGTCAAAAARAASELLLGNELVPAVVVTTPAGIDVVVDVEEADKGLGWARCGVRKDAGDDPDVTDGIMVYATVRLSDVPGVSVDGGAGVGRVTKPGLDQPVGQAAINSVPRSMIEAAVGSAVRAYAHEGGLEVEISIPAGVELAAHTFNPRLGIEGGISVLGTSGIVRPMSEEALVSSTKLELSVLRAEGARKVLLVPGNYGRDFAQRELGLAVGDAVAFSNYLGAALDEASRLAFGDVLVVGHIGKMAKVAAGAMNTHSRMADGRAEVFGAHAALAGASREVVAALMEAPTTDAMVEVVRGAGLLEETMASIMVRMGEVLARRAGSAHVEAIVFSNVWGVLGTTPGALELADRFR